MREQLPHFCLKLLLNVLPRKDVCCWADITNWKVIKRMLVRMRVVLQARLEGPGTYFSSIELSSMVHSSLPRWLERTILPPVEKGSDHVTARQPHRVRPLASGVFIPNLPPLDRDI